MLKDAHELIQSSMPITELSRWLHVPWEMSTRKHAEKHRMGCPARRFDAAKPSAPLESNNILKLQISDAVLCSEMGVHFSPCGRFVAATTACRAPLPQAGVYMMQGASALGASALATSALGASALFCLASRCRPGDVSSLCRPEFLVLCVV